MKINKDFLLKEVAGTYIVIAVGEKSADFSGVVTLNPVGAFLWRKLEEGADSAGLLRAVLEKYDVDEATARTDIVAFLNKARTHGFLEEDAAQ